MATPAVQPLQGCRRAGVPGTAARTADGEASDRVGAGRDVRCGEVESDGVSPSRRVAVVDGSIAVMDDERAQAVGGCGGDGRERTGEPGVTAGCRRRKSPPAGDGQARQSVEVVRRDEA